MTAKLRSGTTRSQLGSLARSIHCADLLIVKIASLVNFGRGARFKVQAGEESLSVGSSLNECTCICRISS